MTGRRGRARGRGRGDRARRAGRGGGPRRGVPRPGRVGPGRSGSPPGRPIGPARTMGRGVLAAGLTFLRCARGRTGAGGQQAQRPTRGPSAPNSVSRPTFAPSGARKWAEKPKPLPRKRWSRAAEPGPGAPGPAAALASRGRGLVGQDGRVPGLHPPGGDRRISSQQASQRVPLVRAADQPQDLVGPGQGGVGSVIRRWPWYGCVTPPAGR